MLVDAIIFNTFVTLTRATNSVGTDGRVIYSPDDEYLRCRIDKQYNHTDTHNDEFVKIDAIVYCADNTITSKDLIDGHKIDKVISRYDLNNRHLITKIYVTDVVYEEADEEGSNEFKS